MQADVAGAWDQHRHEVGLGCQHRPAPQLAGVRISISTSGPASAVSRWATTTTPERQKLDRGPFRSCWRGVGERSPVRWKEWVTGQAARPGCCSHAMQQRASEETGQGKSVKLQAPLLPRVSNRQPRARHGRARKRNRRVTTLDTLENCWGCPGWVAAGRDWCCGYDVCVVRYVLRLLHWVQGQRGVVGWKRRALERCPTFVC
jgi:hypothetical protein